uniref:Cytochrome P450 n=1 Tax=Strigamia maritima TaxID=126957 RepID=T1J9Q9_STRMM
MEAMKKFGNIHGGFVGRLPTLFVSDPELVKQVLVKDFAVFPNRRVFGESKKDDIFGDMLSIMKGDKWKLVRNTLTPTYTSEKLKQVIENGDPIEFTKKFPTLTLDIIASVAFGMKINCIENPNTEFVVNAQKAFRSNVKLIYIMLLFPFLFKWFSNFISNPFQYFSNIANQTIDMRLKNKDFTRKDFLQIMLEAVIPNDETKENQSIGPKKTTTISSIAYELAQNQEIQDKLIKEVDEVMTHTKGKLSYEGVASMKYLDKVTSETLRKYPPALRLDRICSEDDYKMNGINIRKGIQVIIPVYAIHHNPEFYPNPNVFDPERFSPENKAKRNPFTYLFFGAGPRNCIAKRFALMEAKLVVVHMLYNYRFQTCKETEYPIKMYKGTGLLQPMSLKLVLQKRVDQPHFDETVE